MPFDFLLAALATWRVAHLLTREDGPYAMAARLRRAAGDGVAGRALQCFYCTSAWVAAPFALFVASWTVRAVVVWAALSGAACLLDRVSDRETRGVLDVIPLDSPPTLEEMHDVQVSTSSRWHGRATTGGSDGAYRG